MPSCAVCGTSVRDSATHCTTCGMPTGFAAPPPPAPAPVPVVSPPSPFESEASWRDPMPPFVPESGRDRPAPTGRRAGPAPASRRATFAVVAALFVVVVAVLAVAGLPRLLGHVDPQKYVGTWAYAGSTPAKIVITRDGARFTMVFVRDDGARQSLPGKIDHGGLVIDYGRLGPHGATIQKIVEDLGAKLSLRYRRSDDRLVLAASNSQGSYSLVLRRSSTS